MAGSPQEFDAGSALLGLYKDLPYVRKLGYGVGMMGGRIVVRVIIDADRGDDEFYENSMASVRKAREFGDMRPAGMQDEYEVVPIAASPYEGAVAHFRTMTAVIDR